MSVTVISNRPKSSSEDRTVRVGDAETGEMISGPLQGHTGEATSIRFSPNYKRIVSASRDNMDHVWDAETGETVSGFKRHTREVMSVGFSPDGKSIVSVPWDNTIHVWDAETGEVVSGPFEWQPVWLTLSPFRTHQGHLKGVPVW